MLPGVAKDQYLQTVAWEHSVSFDCQTQRAQARKDTSVTKGHGDKGTYHHVCAIRCLAPCTPNRLSHSTRVFESHDFVSQTYGISVISGCLQICYPQAVPLAGFLQIRFLLFRSRGHTASCVAISSKGRDCSDSHAQVERVHVNRQCKVK